MVNGKIITTMPVVKQQATLYFLERGTNQFELSLADDNGVLRTLAGSASGSAVQQTLSQVLATGNKLEGKEIEGDLVVRNTYTSGGSTTGGYRISGNNEGIELSGSGEGYSSILKVGGSWNAVRGDFYYPVDTGTSSGYWQVGARGIQLYSEVPDHSMGTQFRATDKELFYTRYIDGKSPLTFTIQDSGIHSQFPDVELGGDNYITFYINSTNGMFLSKYIKPTRDEEYTQKKYVDDKIAAIGSGGGSPVDAYTKAETDTKIKEIVVGGNNLAKNTSLPIFGQNGPDTGTPEVMKDATGYFVRYTPSATSPVGLYGKKVEGSNLGNHSRSIDVRHSHTSNVTVWGQQVAPNKWVRIKQESFTAPNEFAAISADVPGVALDLRNYKIELGSKATDWSPNIEEFSTATSARKIDEVFTISQEGIEASRVGTDVVFTGVPYAKDIAVILEFYLIFADGVATKVENAQITNDGGIKFPATLAARDIVKKFYLKALIK